MKRILTFILLILFLGNLRILSQSITNYNFSASSGTFTQIVGGTSVSTTVSAADFLGDTKTSIPIPIGFTFYYMGQPYNYVIAMSDGYISFNSSATSNLTNNLTSSAATQRPLIAPLWDDLDGASGSGSASYITEGTTGSRVFTIEWINWQWNYSATGTTISFQVKLYEADGKIQFIYRDDGGTVNSGSASIGITATSTGSGNFLSLDGTGTSPNASSTTETTSLNTKPATGQIYTFAPVQYISPEAPITLGFNSIGATVMNVTWKDNSTTETYFRITAATDAAFTQNVVTIIQNSSTIAGTGSDYQISLSSLLPSTLYYIRISAENEASPPSSFLTGSQSTIAGTMTGTMTIGPTGTYTSIGAAINALQSNGLAGPVIFELQSTYVSTVESFPLAFPNLFSDAAKTVTFRPEAGATNLLISNGGSTASTIVLTDADYITFDGRPGGVGTTSQLTIENTNTATGIRTVLLQNDASNNTFKYCTIKGNLPSTNGIAVIQFGTTTGTTGNDNNLIDNCNIDAMGGTGTAIYSSGTTTTNAHFNSNNTISNCNIYDFYISSTSTTSTYGIRLTTGNTDWTITNNSLYQTSARAYSSTAAIHYMISCNYTSGNNFIVTNNHMGGDSPNSNGTYTISSGSARLFVLEMNVGTTTASSVQGNTIRNINITTGYSSAGSSGFIGIYVSAGNVNIGNITGNTVGSTTSINSIVYNNSGTDAGILVVGANLAGAGTVVFNNNLLGGFTANVSTATVRINLYLISTAVTGPLTISGNTIGSTTVANNIVNNAGNTSTNFNTRGINSTSTNASVIITNNTVANITSTSTNTGPSLVGMYLGPSSASTNYTVTGNTVYNLTTYSSRTSTGSTGPLIGIAFVNTSAGGVHNISNNIVHSLLDTTASAATDIYGIYISNATTTVSTVAGNYIHSLKHSSTGNGRMIGIYNVNCAMNIFNNMVRLGIDKDGNSITGGYWIAGIWKETTQRNSIIHNSVYIGGTGIAGSQNQSTFAFRKSGTGTTDTLMNNIFYNARSNSTSTGKHYAVYLNNTTTLVSDFNLFYVDGTGGVLGTDNGGTNDRTTLTAWKTATSKDGNSGFGNPNFVLPAGNSSNVNLHIQSPTPIESSGNSITYIPTDFDGDTRSSLTPTDIGADAGNFTVVDIFPPAISFTQLGNGTSSNRVLTNFATIKDNVGVSTGANLPRLYYKKSTDVDTLIDNDPASEGWKYVVASNTTSPFSFTIDYSQIYGGFVTTGDIIQYFVVAQDAANNLNSLPMGAGGSPNPPVQNINAAPPTLYSYTITGGISGVKTVGTGGNYTTLTGTGGLFEAINNSAVTGNLTANIISDITEPGTVSLNQWSEEGTGNYTLTIQPNGTTLWTISGTAVTSGNPMININGADRVTINGVQNGSNVPGASYLKFVNTNSTPANTGATIQFTNGSVNCFLINCTIENNGTSTTRGAIVIGSSGTNNVFISSNRIGDATSGTAGAPAVGIYSASSTNTVVVEENYIYNFSNYGVYFSTVGNECTIADNSFYNNLSTPPSTTQYSIYVGAGNNHNITENYIGGSSANCGGTPWINSGAITFYGIYLAVGTATATSVQNNTISNINLTSTSTANFYGIYCTAGLIDIGTMSGNVIGSTSYTPGSPSITLSGTGTVYGIYMTGCTSNIWKNTIANISQTTTSPGIFYAIYLSGTNAYNVGYNTIMNCGATSSSTGTNAIIGIYYAGGSGGTQICTIHNNMISLGEGVSNNNVYKGIDDFGYSGNILKMYYNSVFIGGTGTGTSACYAYLKRDAVTETHYNNIYVNNRSGGSGKYFAIGVTNTSGSFISNYNDLYSTSPTLGVWSTTDITDLTGWKTASTQDANSVSQDPVFQTNSNLHLNTTVTPTFLKGTPISGITDDIDGDMRDNAYPYMGADEDPNKRLSPLAIDGLLNESEYLTVATKQNTNSGFGGNIDVSKIVYYFDNTAQQLFIGVVGKLDVSNNNGIGLWLGFTEPTGIPAGTSLGNNGDGHYMGGNGGSNANFKAGFEVDYMFAINPGTSSNNCYVDIVKLVGTRKAQYLGNCDQSGNAVYGPSSTFAFTSNSCNFAFNNGGGVNQGFEIRIPYSELGITSASNLTAFAFVVSSTAYFSDVTVPGNIATLAPLANLGFDPNFNTLPGGPYYSNPAPLPIELTSFTSDIKDRNVTINWQTQTEVQSSKFVVERALFGTDIWQIVANVKAAGTSNSLKSYSVTDTKLNSGKYQYRLKMIDVDGTYRYSDIIFAEIGTPKTYQLSQNYPNPFNPTTRIDYQLPLDAKVTIELYTISGEKVATLVNNEQTAGYYTLDINASREGLSSGVYIYRMIAQDKVNAAFTQVKKMMMIK